MSIEVIERIGRVVAVFLGLVLLTLTVVGRTGWWGALGVVPLAMGLSGW
jgi:hypothetical protein